MTQSTHAIVSILREQLAGLAQAAQINLEKYQHQRHLYDELATTLQELLDREMSMRKQSWTNFEVQAEAILHNLATRSQHQFAKLHDSHTVLMHGLDQSTKIVDERANHVYRHFADFETVLGQLTDSTKLAFDKQSTALGQLRNGFEDISGLVMSSSELAEIKLRKISDEMSALAGSTKQILTGVERLGEDISQGRSTMSEILKDLLVTSEASRESQANMAILSAQAYDSITRLSDTASTRLSDLRDNISALEDRIAGIGVRSSALIIALLVLLGLNLLRDYRTLDNIMSWKQVVLGITAYTIYLFRYRIMSSQVFHDPSYKTTIIFAIPLSLIMSLAWLFRQALRRFDRDDEIA